MAEAAGNSTPSGQELSERDWRAVEKTLPVGADLAFVRAELERIKRDSLSAKKLIQQFEDHARNCDLLARSSPVTNEQQVRLKWGAQWSREQAKHHALLVGEPKKFRKQAAMLLLWQMQGGGAPSVYKSGEAAAYLRAASLMVFGKVLSDEGAKDVIKKFRDKNFRTATFAGAGDMSVFAGLLRGGKQTMAGSGDMSVFAGLLRDGKLIP